MSAPVFDALTPRQQADLRTFAERLAKQNQSLNMVAPSTIPDLWERHIVDSLQLAPLISAELNGDYATTVLDIGTGGGLPAVPLAISFSQSHNISVQAIDSDQKKIAAIRLMILGLNAPVKLHTGRVETHKVQHDVVTSRALAPLDRLVGWSQSCLKPGGRLVLLKGEQYREEIRDAQVNWHFSTSIHPSVTNQAAAVLVLSDISRKNASSQKRI